MFSVLPYKEMCALQGRVNNPRSRHTKIKVRVPCAMSVIYTHRPLHDILAILEDTILKANAHLRTFYLLCKSVQQKFTMPKCPKCNKEVYFGRYKGCHWLKEVRLLTYSPLHFTKLQCIDLCAWRLFYWRAFGEIY